MDRRQRRFNYCLSKARVSIERAFRTLKRRWRLLSQKISLEPSYAADVVIACTVLHNICQDQNEPVEELFIDDSSNQDRNCNSASGIGEKIRQLLVDYVNEHEDDSE